MPTLNVFWTTPKFDAEQQAARGDEVVTGLLTDEHEAATEDMPVIVDERSSRVYRPGELAGDTVIYVESVPGVLPPLAERARRAGYHVEHAEKSPRRR